jgi:Protein of unknown function (DUF2955)
MHPADKAALRLSLGMGLSVAIAWGVGLEAAFMAPVMTLVLLCKPGPPIPLVKGVVLGLVIAALLLAGVLTVPILEHYPVTGLLLTGTLFFLVSYSGARKANPLTLFMHVALVFIPVAGVAEQAASTVLARTVGVALVIGVLASAISHAMFPDEPGPAKVAAAPVGASPEAAGWIALQASLVVMPVFILALINPAMYLQCVMKTVGIGHQAGSTTARSAGRELVGSTAVGAVLAMVVWGGLKLWPNLWMFALWTAAVSLWVGVRLFRVKATPFPPSYWLNALMTMFFVLGPAIQDSANGSDVYRASAMRVGLFILVALYASATVWALERWRAARSTGLGGALESGSRSTNSVGRKV